MVATLGQGGNSGWLAQIAGQQPGAGQAQPQPGLMELMAPSMPNYWGYQAMANARPQEAYWNLQGDLAGAGASRYATEAGLQAVLSQLPWDYAGTVQQTASASDAAKQVGLYGMMGNIVPAAYQAAAAPEVAGIQADATRYQADAAARAAGYGAYGNMMASYYPAASGITQAGIGAEASMYGAQQGALSNIMASYYPAASGITQAGIGAEAGRDIAQTNVMGQLGQTRMESDAARYIAEQQAGANMGVAGLQAGAGQDIARTQAGAGRDIAQTQAGASMGVAGLEAGAGTDIARLQAGSNVDVAGLQTGAARYIAELQQQQALQEQEARRAGLQMILDLIMPLMGGGPPPVTPLGTSYGAGYG